MRLMMNRCCPKKVHHHMRHQMKVMKKMVMSNWKAGSVVGFERVPALCKSAQVWHSTLRSCCHLGDGRSVEGVTVVCSSEREVTGVGRFGAEEFVEVYRSEEEESGVVYMELGSERNQNQIHQMKERVSRPRF